MSSTPRKAAAERKHKSPVTGDLKDRRTHSASKQLLNTQGDKHQLLLQTAVEKPIVALKKVRKNIERGRRGFRRRLYRNVAVVMAVARKLASSPKKYRTFVKLDFWKSASRRPKGSSADEEILRFCLVYVFDACGKAEIARVYEYNRALMPLFDKKVDPENIPDILEKMGGFEGLGDMATRYARQTGSSSDVPIPPSSESERRSDPQPELDELDADDLIPASVTLAVPKQVPVPAGDRLFKPSKTETLDIDAEPKLISEACNLAEGEEANLLIKRSGMLIKRSGMVGKSVRFVAVSLRRASLSGRSG